MSINETEMIDTKKKDSAIAVAPSEEHVPEKFDNQVEYWLSCIGFAVGFGNVWRFPYMVYKNGGAVFLIPYFCALIFIAVPMYLIETAYGQLIVCKLNQRYSIIKPHWWAVALC